MFVQQGIGLAGRTIVDGNRIATASEVSGDIGAHHGESGDSDIGGSGDVGRGLRVLALSTHELQGRRRHAALRTCTDTHSGKEVILRENYEIAD
ncbi:hypothetical protein ACFSSF_08245 [Dietzia aerolata]|uniref:hypothetical protein n=1 Tax=Dietzia aerolata TaxID=595984 RepID=UPI003633D220